MPSGGPRRNSGRKPGTKEEKAAVKALSSTGSDYLTEAFKKNEKKLVDQYVSLAMSGDKQALKWLLEYQHGKAGTKDQAAPPTTIILKCNVPRPPITQRHDPLSPGALPDPGGDPTGGVLGAGRSPGELPAAHSDGGSGLPGLPDDLGDGGDFVSRRTQSVDGGDHDLTLSSGVGHDLTASSAGGHDMNAAWLAFLNRDEDQEPETEEGYH